MKTSVGMGYAKDGSGPAVRVSAAEPVDHQTLHETLKTNAVARESPLQVAGVSIASSQF